MLSSGIDAEEDSPGEFDDNIWAREILLELPKIHTRWEGEKDAPFELQTSKTYWGSRNIPRDVKSFGNFWGYFTDDIIQHFVENTNSYLSREE